MSDPRSLVLVVRPMDSSNEVVQWGEPVETYDIDCGYMNLADNVEYAEWRNSHLAGAARLEERWPEAAAYIRETVTEQEPIGFEEPEDDEEESPPDVGFSDEPDEVFDPTGGEA